MKGLILPVLLFSLAMVIILWVVMIAKCRRSLGKGREMRHDTAVPQGEPHSKLSWAFVCAIFASIFVSLIAVVML